MLISAILYINIKVITWHVRENNFKCLLWCFHIHCVYCMMQTNIGNYLDAQIFSACILPNYKALVNSAFVCNTSLYIIYITYAFVACIRDAGCFVYINMQKSSSLFMGRYRLFCPRDICFVPSPDSVQWGTGALLTYDFWCKIWIRYSVSLCNSVPVSQIATKFCTCHDNATCRIWMN